MAPRNMWARPQPGPFSGISGGTRASRAPFRGGAARHGRRAKGRLRGPRQGFGSAFGRRPTPEQGTTGGRRRSGTPRAARVALRAAATWTGRRDAAAASGGVGAARDAHQRKTPAERAPPGFRIPSGPGLAGRYGVGRGAGARRAVIAGSARSPCRPAGRGCPVPAPARSNRCPRAGAGRSASRRRPIRRGSPWSRRPGSPSG